MTIIESINMKDNISSKLVLGCKYFIHNLHNREVGNMWYAYKKKVLSANFFLVTIVPFAKRFLIIENDKKIPINTVNLWK